MTIVLIAIHFSKKLSRNQRMSGKNQVRKLRESMLMSKTELARLAGVSTVTIDRIERGEECRMETKRKIVLALGFTLSDREKVFQD